MVHAFFLLLAAQAPATPAGPLSQRLEDITRRVPGRLGVAVVDLDRGTRVAVHGDVPAPMASVFKLLLAVAVLRRTQEQAIPLSTPVHVLWEERNPGWSPLAQRVPRAGLDLSLESLLEAMVSESDNTAADVLLRWMKGPPEVMPILQRLGVGGIRIDRSERELAYDLWGLQPTATPEPLEALLARMERVPKERRLEATRRFSADPRDQASPFRWSISCPRSRRGGCSIPGTPPGSSICCGPAASERTSSGLACLGRSAWPTRPGRSPASVPPRW